MLELAPMHGVGADDDAVLDHGIGADAAARRRSATFSPITAPAAISVSVADAGAGGDEGAGMDEGFGLRRAG